MPETCRKAASLILALFFPILCAGPLPVQGVTDPGAGRAYDREDMHPDDGDAAGLEAWKSAGGKRGSEEVLLIPGGEPFGIRFYTDGAQVCRVEKGGPAESAGLVPGDLIVGCGGEEIHGLPRLLALLNACGDGPVRLLCERDGQKREVLLTPREGAGEERIGVELRDSMAGIGTITFYEPESGAFGGLGHGICRDESRELLPLKSGTITDVRITSVTKGRSGAPGQLRGLFYPGGRGEVKKNTASGIFGVVTGELPKRKAIPAARPGDVKPGKATILCTLDNGGPREYEIEIEKIYKDETGGRNYLLHVTDKALLETAGGIVQGMSGSPILQNGRIVGAVTHVLVEDSARGYGICIGNMIENMA